MIPEDQPTLDVINSLHPRLRPAARDAYEACRTAGLSIRFTSGLRTIASQNKLYAQGRTAPGPIVTKAKGGQSRHNYGLALDFALLTPGGQVSWDEAKDQNGDHLKDWGQVVQIFLARGWEWGGGAAFVAAGIRDAPHMQKKMGLTIKTAYAKYTAGQVTGGYINI